MRHACIFPVILLLVTSHTASAWPHPTLEGKEPIVIAHRGSSGHLPEETLEAFTLAIEQGADYVELDLVMTKDGHLVVRHDAYLSTTTNVAELEEFADRRRELGGRSDWWVEDFTLEEIRRLRARQPFPGRARDFDDRFRIASFTDVLALVRSKEKETGRRIGVYPEIKQPEELPDRGEEKMDALIADLEQYGYDGGDDALFVQSFDAEVVRRLSEATDYALIMLIYEREEDEVEPHTPSFALEEAARFADGVGPSKALLLTDDGEDRGYVARAHELGLAVHPWTLRDDAHPERYEAPAEEYVQLMKLGVDGLFTDFPDTGVTQRGLTRWRSESEEREH